jgi:AhpD family alkylhydroperoxidase
MMAEPTEGSPIMTAKLDPFAAAPELMKAWHRTSLAISSSLDPGLSELVEIRASQINGCANCLNMHTVFAREHGANSASTCCPLGARPLAIPIVSVLRSAGPRL